jgi:hypothetical protein
VIALKDASSLVLSIVSDPSLVVDSGVVLTWEKDSLLLVESTITTSSSDIAILLVGPSFLVKTIPSMLLEVKV